MGNERWITSRETGARQGRGADWLVGRLYVRRYKYRGSAVTPGAIGLSRNAPGLGAFGVLCGSLRNMALKIDTV